MNKPLREITPKGRVQLANRVADMLDRANIFGTLVSARMFIGPTGPGICVGSRSEHERSAAMKALAPAKRLVCTSSVTSYEFFVRLGPPKITPKNFTKPVRTRLQDGADRAEALLRELDSMGSEWKHVCARSALRKWVDAINKELGNG